MKVVNYTPLPHLLFERRDADDRRWGVLVVEGTFVIDTGAPLRLAQRQDPVHVGDTYRDDPRTSSLRRATSTATFKPRTDVQVDGVARSPGGVPRSEWPIRIRVGALERDWLVRGPHEWRHGMTGWWRTDPAPCHEVPLHYENAFGGRITLEDGSVAEEARNPVGTGFLPRGIATRDPVRAPQLVAVDEPEHRPGGRYAPRGCGPIPPHFAPRTLTIGTCDEAWRRTQWPRVPRDFDYAHYQSAHPDLVYPGYLEGGEEVQLVHLGPRGSTISTQIPRFAPYALIRLRGGALTSGRFRCDTLYLAVGAEDPREHRAHLTWRLVFPWSTDVRGVEVRLPMSEPAEARVHG